MPDTSWTDQPTCPYCGHIERDAWEIPFDSIDGEVVQTCAHCGEDYHLSRNAIITYTSEPLKKADTRDAGSEVQS
ncbi:hypothetical protein [Luteibacter sp. SG786]|uniref:hypothetical protein n=1 Tax=Luteibacter sp. SG786 TaxID=2587130 RepID=UPI00141F6CD8|nr:hypothetical protein [Luteibacter sp. SG786]NII53539.1 DNA-directed RNA polymerase subunit RPC12/RpoP [Luteibacter sp. SG786]